MDEWNTRQHGKSGLTERVRASPVTAAEAEQQTLAFLAQHLAPKASPMCGNSICQDRRFMAREMPALEAFFHYRNLDVSTLKILAGLWAPAALEGVVKNTEHLALADIHESIAELRHYRAQLLRASGSTTDCGIVQAAVTNRPMMQPRPATQTSERSVARSVI